MRLIKQIQAYLLEEKHTKAELLSRFAPDERQAVEVRFDAMVVRGELQSASRGQFTDYWME